MGSNILYICQNALGDIITTLPSIHFLRQFYPNGRLDVCVNADYTDIFAGDHNVNSVIAAPREWFRLETNGAAYPIKRLPGFQADYDVVVDSMCSKQTAELILLLRPHWAAGIGFDETAHVYDLPLPLESWQAWSTSGRTALDCFADLVRLFECSYSPSEPVLYVTDAAQEQGKAWLARQSRDAFPVVALNPGAGNPMKRWPMQRFMELACCLSDANFQPLFIFGPKEANLYREYAKRIKAMGGLIFRSVHYAVQPLAGILRQCALLVTNDCAVMHVGAAIGCPVVAIFGPSQSRVWFPYSKIHNHVVERDVQCRQACRNGCKATTCLTDITTEDVLSVVRAVNHKSANTIYGSKSLTRTAVLS